MTDGAEPGDDLARDPAGECAFPDCERDAFYRIEATVGVVARTEVALCGPHAEVARESPLETAEVADDGDGNGE